MKVARFLTCITGQQTSDSIQVPIMRNQGQPLTWCAEFEGFPSSRIREVQTPETLGEVVSRVLVGPAGMASVDVEPRVDDGRPKAGDGFGNRWKI